MNYALELVSSQSNVTIKIGSVTFSSNPTVDRLLDSSMTLIPWSNVNTIEDIGLYARNPSIGW